MEVSSVNLLQGGVQSSSSGKVFMDVCSHCLESLSSYFLKEWGEAVHLTESFQKEDEIFQQIESREGNSLLLRCFTLQTGVVAVLLVDRAIPSMLVDLACGGGGEKKEVYDELAPSETYMLNSLIDTTVGHYEKALRDVLENNSIEMAAMTSKSVSKIQISNYVEFVHAITLSIGDSKADIKLGIAEKGFAQLQNITDGYVEQLVDPDLLKEAVQTVPISLTATLYEHGMLLGEIKKFQRGDFIPMNISPLAKVASNNYHLFNAKVVTQKGRLCIQVLEPIGKAASGLGFGSKV